MSSSQGRPSAAAQPETPLHVQARSTLAFFSKALLVRNLMAHGSANLIVALLQMLVLAVFARVLNTDALAGYVLSIAAIALSEVLSDFGTRHWAIRELSKHYSQTRFKLALQIKAVFSIITLLAGFAYWGLSDQSLLTIMLIVLIGMSQSAGDPWLWRLRASQALQQEAKLVVFNRALIATTSIIAGWHYQSLTAILTAWLACNVIRLLLELTGHNEKAYQHSEKENSTPTTHLAPITNSSGSDAPLTFVAILAGNSAVMRVIVSMGLSTILYAIYYRLGVLYLDSVAESRVIATFGLFFSLASAATIASNTLANVYYPRLSKVAGDGSHHALNSQLRQLLTLFGSLFLAGGLIGILISEWVVSVYAGSDYAGTGYLRHLIPWIYLTGFASCLRVALLATGQNRYEFFINVASVGLLVILLQWLPENLSAINRVIAAYTMSEFLACGLRAIKLSLSGTATTTLWLVLSGAGLLVLLVFI